MVRGVGKVRGAQAGTAAVPIAQDEAVETTTASSMLAAVKIQDAKAHKRLAHTVDDAAFRAFPSYQASHRWLAGNSYLGKLEGRLSATPVDNRYLVWLFKDGTLYLKWVQADYKATMAQIQSERQTLYVKMYMASMARRFRNLLQTIQVEQQALKGDASHKAAKAA